MAWRVTDRTVDRADDRCVRNGDVDAVGYASLSYCTAHRSEPGAELASQAAGRRLCQFNLTYRPGVFSTGTVGTVCTVLAHCSLEGLGLFRINSLRVFPVLK